jgi:glycosyltransferase involved in cell wall biosynthesis
MKFIEENPDGVTAAEIVVGIPSRNEAARISIPTSQADKGLARYFRDRNAVLINCDNNSSDGTREAFLATSTRNPKIYLSTPEGVTGKGNNLRNLFEKAVELEARAIVVLDADLRSITPLWIRNLVEPLFEGFGFVTPLYVRHKYDRIVANSIAYPLTRALYGRRVRQPIGGEFGFSGELAKLYVEADSWTEAVGDFGIDVWMTTVAVLSPVAVVQSFLGKPKIHRSMDPEADPGRIFRSVVTTIFDLMARNYEFWKDVKWSRPTAVFGFGAELEVPPPVQVDTEMLRQRFAEGMRSFTDLYRVLLVPETFDKMREVAELSREGFEFPTPLWANVLYDFARGYKDRIVDPEQVVEGLIPLYQGRILSFVTETEAMNNQQVEEIIEDQCLQFEKAKPYLLERWTSR